MGTDLKAQLDSMMADYRATTARLGTIVADLSAVTATAHSADRCVSVTVGAHGELVGLTIDPRRAESLDMTRLASRILEASGVATARIRERIQATVAATLPEGLRHVVGSDGSLNLNGLLPQDPGQAGDPARLFEAR
jgi:DNA-binding protein YbaB